MKHFTRENMPGYSDAEIAALNIEFDRRLADFFKNMADDTTSTDFEVWLKKFDDEVRARRE